MQLFVDLHIHTCLSPCGDELMTPCNIAGMAHLKGLDVISICDHNTMGNLEAVWHAAETYNLAVLPGIELTTREEAHMLGYFNCLESALKFASKISAILPSVPNNPRFFGKQTLMNKDDEETGEEKRLLISALPLSFEECAYLICEYGGLCVPAHINRGSNGVINTLGFLPEGLPYAALEMGAQGQKTPLKECFTPLPKLYSSDAHYLQNIAEKQFCLNACQKSAEAVFDSIKNKSCDFKIIKPI